MYLRKIRKGRWKARAEFSWLNGSELQSDPLSDLTTLDNKLSIWSVKDDLSNLEQIIVALASNCDSASNLDYVLFPEAITTSIGIKTEVTHGKTPYVEANAWHINFVEISCEKLVILARHLLDMRLYRINEKDVVKKIKEAISQGKISRDKLNESLRNSLSQSK